MAAFALVILRTDASRVTEHLLLAVDIYCLPRWEGEDDPHLPEGTPIRDLWRGENYGELGWSWRFQASLDGGETWVAFETQWNGEEPFPVMI